MNQSPSLVGVRSVALLGLCVKLTGASSIEKACPLHLPINISCIFSHVKLKNGLFIPVLKKRATCYKKRVLKSAGFQKNNRNFKTPPVAVEESSSSLDVVVDTEDGNDKVRCDANGVDPLMSATPTSHPIGMALTYCKW
jgi:hypothetical protein